MEINIVANLNYTDLGWSYLLDSAIDLGVVKQDGQVIKPFFLLKESRTCNDELGYLGYGDCLPSDFKILVDEETVVSTVKAVEVYNSSQDQETVNLYCMRIIPRPLIKKKNGLLIHREF